jgi:hypothetical protein
MRRPRTQVSHENLVEEARFILRTLLRDDLFGARVRLTEAERVIASSITLAFADYCAFLSKYGYVRVDQLANVVEVTDLGSGVARNPDDPQFHALLAQHFARELGATPAVVARASKEPAPVAAPVAAAIAVAPPRASVSVSAPPPAGEDVLDRRFRRGATIGAGPVGTVAEGEHLGLGRAVAIKEARSIFQFVSYLKRDEIVRRLKSAVQTNAALVHPNIVQILDQNHEREFPYFVAELAEGGNLRQRMDAGDEGRLPAAVAIRVLIQLCYALKYAHESGVLHLGIKPENVLFDRLGNVKLSDFGFSTIMDRQVSESQVPVLVGSGTVAYMAPERLQPDADAAELGPAADIYAAGILTYQMLTGKLPGRRSPLPSQARKAKDLPAAFDDVFDKMTRDEIEDRYASFDEVLAGLYKAFPSKEVFSEGTILLWASDPNPLPAASTEVAEEALDEDALDDEDALVEAEAVEAEDAVIQVGDASVPDFSREISSEAKTGEVDTRSLI